jgi:hypothetical protein
MSESLQRSASAGGLHVAAQVGAAETLAITSQHCGLWLGRRAQIHDVEGVRSLVANKADVNARTQTGDTPLHWVRLPAVRCACCGTFSVVSLGAPGRPCTSARTTQPCSTRC